MHSKPPPVNPGLFPPFAAKRDTASTEATQSTTTTEENKDSLPKKFPWKWTLPQILKPPKRFDHISAESRGIHCRVARSPVKVAKGSHVQMSHHLFFGSKSPPHGYMLNLAYGKRTDPFIQMNMDSDYSLKLHMRTPYMVWSKGFISAGINGEASFEEERNRVGVELTAGTRDSIAEFRYDWGQGIALSFVQAITNRFSLGASWQYIPAYAIGFVSLGSRYKKDGDIYTVQGSLMGLNATFTRLMKWTTVDGKAALSTEFNIGRNPHTGQLETAAAAGYSVMFNGTGSALHGRIDSNGRITACVEENIAAVIRLSLCAETGIATPGEYRIGIVLQYMGQ